MELLEQYKHWLWVRTGVQWSTAEIKRLVIYRNAVQQGFYTDNIVQARAA